MSQNGNQMVDDVLRYFLFGLQRIILATFAINNANLVCIVTEAGSRVIQRVEDDKVKVFTFELSFGILYLCKLRTVLMQKFKKDR